MFLPEGLLIQEKWHGILVLTFFTPSLSRDRAADASTAS